MQQHLCVYCSSSDAIGDAYFDVARRVGQRLAERGVALVFGGGSVGLMGAVARAVHEGGGTVVGVIPEALKSREGVAYEEADELITTETMQQRKAHMYRRADAFAALPGGFGTLEEFMEVLTLKQLRYHDKPLVLVNTDGFYDPLIRFFDQLYEQKFARARQADLYHVAADADEALDYIQAYRSEEAVAEGEERKKE